MAWIHKGRKYWYHNGTKYSCKYKKPFRFKNFYSSWSFFETHSLKLIKRGKKKYKYFEERKNENFINEFDTISKKYKDNNIYQEYYLNDLIKNNNYYLKNNSNEEIKKRLNYYNKLKKEVNSIDYDLIQNQIDLEREKIF